MICTLALDYYSVTVIVSSESLSVSRHGPRLQAWTTSPGMDHISRHGPYLSPGMDDSAGMDDFPGMYDFPGMDHVSGVDHVSCVDHISGVDHVLRGLSVSRIHPDSGLRVSVVVTEYLLLVRNPSSQAIPRDRSSS